MPLKVADRANSRRIKKYSKFLMGGMIFVLFSLFLGLHSASASNAPQPAGDFEIVGNVLNRQNQPVGGVTIQALASSSQDQQALAETESNADGTWTLRLSSVPDSLTLQITRPHYQATDLSLSPQDLLDLRNHASLVTPEVTLERRVDAGFWAATGVFLFVLLIIAFEKLHTTTASLTAMSAIFLISFVGGAITPSLYIFSFEQALTYINWQVIFLVMGMMIIIAVIEGTGIFQWTAFQAYRLSRGKNWLLVLILMIVTGIASALLDNFTTMLLMTPITMEIGIALGINPIALIIPEILSSNVTGISTLIGTPTNIVIGAYAGIGFNDFLANQTLGVLLAFAGMAAFVLFYYRKELRKQSGEISPRLYDLLKRNSQITDKTTLWKAGLVFLFVLVGFALGERIDVPPAVPALVGATLLFVWLRPDVNKTIEAVDWTTLVFFISLFIVVGAVQEVGLIAIIADGMKSLVGDSLILAVIVIIFGAGTLSTAIANIPLATSLLPVVEYLSGSIPGASSKVLYYALSMGAAMGGNGLLIGGEANLVTSGITEQAGRPISFKEFMKIGLPVTYITLALGTIWLLVQFIVFG